MNRRLSALLLAIFLLSIAAAVFFGIEYVRLTGTQNQPTPAPVSDGNSGDNRSGNDTIAHSLPAPDDVVNWDIEDTAQLMENFFSERQAQQSDLEIVDEELRQDLQNRHKKERFMAQFDPDVLPVGRDRFCTQRYSAEHPAIDFAAPQGAEVYAVASGVVRFSYADRHLGNVLVIDHLNGYASLYAHLSDCLFGPGRFVEKGDTVARVGNTGNSTAPHLHIELWFEGIRIDPALRLPIEEAKPMLLE
ncbi:MAG: M23 family metallopeptidase [Candidatus Cloacimonetes bacterium]|nr:M23 family metallopeptidase [Candidatus Cloacimonadota bacterium]